MRDCKTTRISRQQWKDYYYFKDNGVGGAGRAQFSFAPACPLFPLLTASLEQAIAA